jgi:hypothetical protein
MSKREHAVVVGGSMAGMLAARVLSDHFEWVTIVEEDRYPSSVGTRAGVPQSRHLHALLLRGLQIVTRLFPGIDKELVAAGAVPVDVARDFAWYTSAGWAVNFDSGMEMLSFTRELLDWHIRQRVAALPNIQILDECGVMGLVEQRGSATGILLEESQGADIDAGEQLRANLVVDATGRRSRASEWLTTLGYPAPEETVVNSHLGYASRLYRRRTRRLWDAGKDYSSRLRRRRGQEPESCLRSKEIGGWRRSAGAGATIHRSMSLGSSTLQEVSLRACSTT